MWIALAFILGALAAVAAFYLYIALVIAPAFWR